MRVIKHYTVPSGASHAGTQQLRFLAEFDRKQYRKVGGTAGKSDLNDARCLEYYAKRAGLGRSAYEASGTMWNSEYVIALILTSNDLGDAIPDGWLEPRGKRNKLPVQAPVPVALAVPETREAPLPRADSRYAYWQLQDSVQHAICQACAMLAAAESRHLCTRQ